MLRCHCCKSIISTKSAYSYNAHCVKCIVIAEYNTTFRIYHPNHSTYKETWCQIIYKIFVLIMNSIKFYIEQKKYCDLEFKRINS